MDLLGTCLAELDRGRRKTKNLVLFTHFSGLKRISEQFKMAQFSVSYLIHTRIHTACYTASEVSTSRIDDTLAQYVLGRTRRLNFKELLIKLYSLIWITTLCIYREMFECQCKAEDYNENGFEIHIFSIRDS